MELCKSLRWKGFHSRDWSSPEELIARLVQPEVPFSCLRTCQPWGPDDGPSAPGDCASHRGSTVRWPGPATPAHASSALRASGSART
jgi:hypothetical protein